MTDAPEDEWGHRALRELLGSHALGQLPAAEATRVQAHLDGCADCRAELAEISTVLHDLRGVDPEHVSTQASPPADLGGRIGAAVAAESMLRDRRRSRVTWGRRVLAAAAAAVLIAAGAVVGGAVFPRTEVVTQAAPPGPFEPIEVRTGLPGLRVSKAGVVPHPWGVEVRIEGTGFPAGQAFRAVVVGADGRTRPAGQFLGTGERALTCNLQAALLRRDTSRFVVLDATGVPVLSADLPG